MPSENKGAGLLEEAVKPHLATDQGQKFLAGQARVDEIRVRLFFLLLQSSSAFFLFFPFLYRCHSREEHFKPDISLTNHHRSVLP